MTPKRQNTDKEKLGNRFHQIINFLILLLAISAVFALVSFQLIGNNLTVFYHVQYETTKNQMEIRKDVQTMNKRILWSIICNDPEVTAEQKSEFDSRFAKIDSYLEIIGTNLKDKNASAALKTAFDDFYDGTYHIIELVEQNDIEGATTYYETTFNDISEVLADALDKVGTEADKEAANKYTVSKTIQIIATLVLVIIFVISIIVSKKRGNKLCKVIEDPLLEIENATKEIAQGNLHTKITYSSNNEIGQLADNLRNSMEKLSSYIDDIDMVMNAMAQGKFNTKFTNHFVGDFSNIEKSMNYFAEKISESMKRIEEAADNVSDGASQIADASQTLAEGATNQAGIVEELSATIGSVSERITDNAQNAEEISQEVSDMATDITKGNERMKEVVHAMETISTTSEEIHKIIDTIDSIAAQTNLLALNASIEAARAGEAGKGFAVVADQVSLLASQSAQAAQTSNQYIEASIKAVEDGKKLADNAAEKLNEVATAADTITKKVDNIAIASKEQAEQVKQIDQGIEQIVNVVESNAATSQESSASSEELSSEAETLKSLVNQFELRK